MASNRFSRPCRQFLSSPEADNMTTRVLHVSEAYGGGIQTAIRSYILNSPPGVIHEVLARHRTGHETGADVGAKVSLVAGSLPAFLLHVRKSIVEQSPDVVHLHSSFAGLCRAVIPGTTRVVYTPHAYSFLRTDRSLVSRLLFLLAEFILGRWPHSIAAISPFEYRLARRLVSSNVDVYYLPNVVNGSADGGNHESSKSLPADSGKQDEAIDIVTVGRVAPQKDPRFIAEVAGRLRGDYRWIWIGDGDKDSVEVLEQAGVEVVGWMNNSRVVEKVKNSKLYVHGAAWEGAPVTLLEAVWADTPVIVRSVPSLVGLGFPEGGPTAVALASAIDDFFENRSFASAVRKSCELSKVVHSPKVQSDALKRLYCL